MGFISDTLFGGAERRAGRVQQRAIEEGRQRLQGLTGQALSELRGAQPGAEQALLDALNQQQSFLRGGQRQALDALFRGGQQAMGQFGQAEQALSDLFGQGQAQLQPFAEGGQQAFQQQLAFSGALGPQAQQQAFQGFVESPGQQFLQEAGARQINRAAAAGGQAGGGRVMDELMRQGQGLAQQDFGNFFNRLQGTAGQGQQAAGQLANLLAQQGQGVAGIRGQQAQLLNQLGGNQANIFQNFASQLGAGALGAGGQLSGLRSQLGSNLANALINQAQQEANMISGAGQAQASGILDSAAQTRNMGMNIGLLAMLSDKNMKTDVKDLSGEEAFEIVMNLDVKRWRYLTEKGLPEGEHFGPMAQDAPDCITDSTKKVIHVHDEMMLMAKAMQWASKNRFRILELVEKWEAA